MYSAEKMEDGQMNDLQIVNLEQTDITAWDFAKIKEELAHTLSQYRSIVYTDDTIQSAKNDKATLAKAKNIHIIYAQKGDMFSFASGLRMDVISPDSVRRESTEANDTSIVLKTSSPLNWKEAQALRISVFVICGKVSLISWKIVL